MRKLLAVLAVLAFTTPAAAQEFDARNTVRSKFSYVEADFTGLSVAEALDMVWRDRLADIASLNLTVKEVKAMPRAERVALGLQRAEQSCSRHAICWPGEWYNWCYGLTPLGGLDWLDWGCICTWPPFCEGEPEDIPLPGQPMCSLF